MVDIENVYLQINGIPQYQPSYGLNNIKGLWKTETTNNDTDNYYGIGYYNRGWLDNNNIRQGTSIKIPLEPKYATENIYDVSSSTTIQEVFWYKDDLNWKSIMVNGNYDTKLFTPMGAIGITVTGIPIYNFAVMKNSLLETYSSKTLSTNISSQYSVNTSTNTSYGSSTASSPASSTAYSAASSTANSAASSTAST